MHDDLRRRALESGKTTSSKAKSKQSSGASSRPNSKSNSRSGSRVQSRDASDDEDANGNLSDDTTFSINSIDALLESDDFNEQATDTLKQDLNDCMVDLVDRKGSSVKSREDSLTTYVRILTAHHIADALYGRVSELLASFMRSVRAETSEKETTLALRAIALTAITYADETLFETVSTALKRTISNSQSNHVKATAILTLGICLSFGGAGEEEVSENMTFLLEIVSSDGSFVDAGDNGEVVTAALQTYGFLATQVEDLEDESEDAIAAFLDQLDSDDTRVEIAAGENIALLYEKSYTPIEEDETTSDFGEHDDDSSDDGHAGDSSLIKRYNAYHNTNEVMEKVTSLSSLSTKTLNKRDKKQLHQAFASITMTVQDPRIGLQSNNSSKLMVRVHKTGEMQVDKWWKLMRLNAIRRLLAGGFVNHYFEGNKQLLDALPIIMRETNEEGAVKSPKRQPPAKATKGRFRGHRRFVSGGHDDSY